MQQTGDEYFIMETRQNRNYEAGTIFEDDDQPAAEETRGIFNPDKQGDPKDSVNPARRSCGLSCRRRKLPARRST